MLRSHLEAAVVEIKDLKHKLDHSSTYTILSSPCEACVSLKGKLFHATKENTALQLEVAVLTACLEKTALSEKMIEENLSRVEESATKSTYRLSVGFERCENKGEKSAPKFISSSTYHKEEAIIKSTKAHCPSNPNSYHDEFIDFSPRSYSHVPPRFYSRVSPRTFSRALPCTFSSASSQFTHGPNHHSYGFGPRENCFESRRFGYGPCPHRGDRFPRRLSFSARGSFPQFEPRHLDGPCFPCRGSRPTRPSGEVQRSVKTSSGRMVKCWIPKIYLTNPSTESLTFSCPM
jgi:hypothetical protein